MYKMRCIDYVRNNVQVILLWVINYLGFAQVKVFILEIVFSHFQVSNKTVVVESTNIDTIISFYHLFNLVGSNDSCRTIFPFFISLAVTVVQTKMISSLVFLCLDWDFLLPVFDSYNCFPTLTTGMSKETFMFYFPL